MRTKALLLTAALGLASAATSMAQAVYSVNVVGYINLTMKPGYNLVANQLNASPNNNVNSVIPSAPEEALLLKYGNGNYTVDIFLGSWVDALTAEPSVTTISPGEGFFFFNPGNSDVTSTLVGEVRTGNGLNVTMNPGYTLASSIVPQEISLTSANGFPEVEEALFLTFNADTQNYNTALIYLGGWVDSLTADPADAKPTVGQGFFYFNPGNTAQTWTRSFNPNN